VALAGATVLLQLGPNIGVLILGRVLQGISAAVVWVVGLALLVDSVPREELGQAMGIVFLAMSLGVLIGPLLGGVLFEKVGYDAVYGMAYAFIALDILFRLLMVENPIDHQAPAPPLPTLEPEAPVISEKKAGKARKRDSTPDISTLTMKDLDTKGKVTTKETISSELSSELSSVTSRETPETCPMARVRPAILILISSPRMLACLWGVMVVAILGAQFDSVLPLLVKNTFGWDSTAAGLVFLPITLTAFLSPIVGWGVDRFGPRWFAVAGFLSAAPLEVLLSLIKMNTLAQKALLCVLLGLMGISFDLTITPLLVEITAVVEAKEIAEPGIFGPKGAMAQAYGLFNLAWAMGSLVGPIWAGFVNEKSGWKAATWSLALLSLVTVAPSALWTGGLLWRKKVKEDEETS